jgi:hypothetical protein
MMRHEFEAAVAAAIEERRIEAERLWRARPIDVEAVMRQRYSADGMEAALAMLGPARPSITHLLDAALYTVALDPILWRWTTELDRTTEEVREAAADAVLRHGNAAGLELDAQSVRWWR